MPTPHESPKRTGARADLALGLLAGLMLLLSVPVLVESAKTGPGRLVLLLLLVPLPVLVLFVMQRRAGGPEIPDVYGRRR
ncbi:MAG: hypothetical protein VX265_02325 [Myxococcota bacterium]|nr:hypothetical protein [Myxococcota bacterium]MEC8424280.1 hypothetical protein [Myxococcota bacterium]